MIVDEATLAGTTTLDRITGIAAGAGAKVLLVGDPTNSSPSTPAGPSRCSSTDERMHPS